MGFYLISWDACKIFINFEIVDRDESVKGNVI